MTKIKYSLIVILLLTLSGGAFIYRLLIQPRLAERVSPKAVYYCPMHPSYTSDRPGDCPICNMKLVKRDDPRGEVHHHEDHLKAEPKVMTLAELKAMKPGQICLLHKCKMGTCMMAMTDEMARLGKCPHCGEDLGVVIKDLMPAGYSHVKLSREKQEMIGVKTAPVQKMTLPKKVRTAGKVAFDRELYQMEAEYLEAFDMFRKMGAGKKQLEQMRLRLKREGLSDELIAEIEKAKKPDKRLIYPGKSGPVWVYMPVYDYEFFLLRPGQKIEAGAPVLPGKKFEGVIRAVSQVPDPLTRTVQARALFENPEGLLRPQMDINAVIQVEMRDARVVPGEAVFSTGEKHIVFLARPGGIFEPREVEPGILAEEGREIRGGLAEGDQVVISGNFLIDSESRLKGSLEGMSGGGHQHGG